ncbi:hypothetical protein P7H14_16935 [Paenibacillus larvae]|nr:hypothetical protein [Paenibacillus larvae]MDT2193519.1 hypothetical protein [Paenibacillus larvae]MDT2238917.1 hypothetical protein [Paenibacillus larvae]MDT2275923.1 hypothetical protein [Paenibacillus larvae]MDT2291818.1 hypothetical protein [Paenibacillus larvae]
MLFKKHWDGLPVRKISVSLEELVRDDTMQLTFLKMLWKRPLTTLKTDSAMLRSCAQYPLQDRTRLKSFTF